MGTDNTQTTVRMLQVAFESLPDDRELAFRNKIYMEDDCWIYGTPLAYGYVAGVRANRIAFELWVGPIPDGLNVLHKCDVPGCVNPEHLFVGTQQQNMLDRISKGRGRGVLTPELKAQVRLLYSQNMKKADIAKCLKVPKHIIYEVLK